MLTRGMFRESKSCSISCFRFECYPPVRTLLPFGASAVPDRAGEVVVSVFGYRLCSLTGYWQVDTAGRLVRRSLAGGAFHRLCCVVVLLALAL